MSTNPHKDQKATSSCRLRMPRQWSVTTWIAFYGALTATVALSLDVYSCATDKPHLHILPRSAPPIISGGLFAHPFSVVYEITLLNTGTKRITITAGAVKVRLNTPVATSDDPNASSPHLYFTEFALDHGISVPQELLPITLESGGAAYVPITLRLEGSPKPFEGSWFTGALDLEFTTTAGTLHASVRCSSARTT